MASDYLLEIDGIKGESSDKAFKEAIELESFSWGAVQCRIPFCGRRRRGGQGFVSGSAFHHSR